MRAGLIAAVIVNTSPNRKKGAKPVKPQDFFRARQRVMTVEETEAALDAWMIRQNRRHES